MMRTAATQTTAPIEVGDGLKFGPKFIGVVVAASGRFVRGAYGVATRGRCSGSRCDPLEDNRIPGTGVAVRSRASCHNSAVVIACDIR
jgi:hypothetical protein